MWIFCLYRVTHSGFTTFKGLKMWLKWYAHKKTRQYPFHKDPPFTYFKPSVDISWLFYCCQTLPKVNKLVFLLAEYYITPHPTTTDVERLFSTARDIITNERSKLNPGTAEKILFLRENLPKIKFQYWFHSYIVTWK